jgi:DNA polymerase-3 subunit epsilon
MDTKYFIHDTEGTGLFKHRNEDGSVCPSDAPGQPRMAEYAAVLLDEDFNVVDTYQQYVIPVGWEFEEMPAEAFAVHGLSMDFLREKGRPVQDALNVYTGAVMFGHILVGFNQQHDGRQMRAELRRAGMDDLFEQTPNICAMRSITKNYKGQIKKLNGKSGFPRLIDAAAHFGIPYAEDKRHTALEDALVTAQVAKRLHEMGKLLPAAVHYAKGHVTEGEAA